MNTCILIVGIIAFIAMVLLGVILSYVKKNNRIYQELLFKEENNSFRKIKELVFKIGILSHSGKACIWDYDIQKDKFNYIDSTNSFYKGYSMKEYLSMVHPDDRHIPETFLNDLIAGKTRKTPQCYRLFVPRFNSYRWMEVVGMVSENSPEGKPRYLTGLRWDVSIRKEQQIKLEENMRITRLALDKFDVYPWEYIVENKCLYLYNRSDDSFTEEYPLDHFMDEIVHPEDKEKCQEALKNYLITPKVDKYFDVRVRILRKKTNEYAWVDITGAPLEEMASGKITKMVGIGRVVSEEVAKDVQLSDTTEMLQHSLAASEIIPFEFLPEEMVLFSPAFDMVSSNNKVSLAIYSRLWLHPDSRNTFQEQLNGLVSGNYDTFNLRVKARIKLLGEYEWVHITAKSLRKDSDGKAQRVFGTLRTVTKEVVREKELVDLREKAEESNRLMSAFLANISHEVRTPLNAIVGFSQLIPDARTPEEAQQYIELIRTNNDLLLQLINDVLDISRMDAGKYAFEYNEVDVCGIVSDLKWMYSDKINENVTLNCELPDKAFVMRTERNRLTQVLSNFVSNAVKFTQKGKITIGYDHLKNATRFYVRDTGKGIAREHLSKVFDRFTKLDTFAQGTGLGLSVCRMIVEKLQGEIGVESEPGKGSEFWFTVPMVAS